MIDMAKKGANEIKSKPKIMMVSILTSLNDESLKEMGGGKGKKDWPGPGQHDMEDSIV